jgi:hypothetical protein
MAESIPGSCAQSPRAVDGKMALLFATDSTMIGVTEPVVELPRDKFSQPAMRRSIGAMGYKYSHCCTATNLPMTRSAARFGLNMCLGVA